MAGMTTSSNDESGDLSAILSRIAAHVSYIASAYGYDGGARGQRGDPCGDPPLTQKEKT
jgi:hypothetical protein